MSDARNSISQTILSHFEGLYLPHKLAGGAESTLRQYRASIRNFGMFLESIEIHRSPELCDFRDDLIHRAAHWLVKVRKRKPHTALKMQENLLAIWRFLAQKGIVSEFPSVKLIEVPLLIPTAWTKSELRTLWRACQRQHGDYSGISCAGWWHALHSVIWDTGERISAVMRCRWSDVDLKGRYLLVHADYRKGKKADKIFRLHPDTILLLKAIREPDRGLIFPAPGGSVQNLWNHYKRLLHEAGLPFDRYHMFHCLRRSTASYLEVAGGDATEHLGHSSRQITLKYLDPRIVKKKHASDLLFRPNPPKAG